VNQQTGGRQGNANYVLYALAATKETYSTCKFEFVHKSDDRDNSGDSVFLFVSHPRTTFLIACVAVGAELEQAIPGSGYGLIISALELYGAPRESCVPVRDWVRPGDGARFDQRGQPAHQLEHGSSYAEQLRR